MSDLADAWTLILDHCARDTRGKHAVPALALVATYRAVCTEARRGAAGVVTPFDAVISFAPNGRTRVPVSFYGGVHFAEHRYWAGLSIIRDAACSPSPGWRSSWAATSPTRSCGWPA
jgi:hypothetical protein